ncbi:unnamed protein product [Aspergillus oryzae]|uniref:pectinesterase n=2 Tax=Aspergillus oryzae TaxID=5062 RepID=A0AAN4YT22_ASPOZ|nr:unnamed protein product [Aspergillus oryzae]GMF86548.1 unnamed protein product [Aspergillus oryzae]GMG10390.1 unnamed protein product [Aspergillus oryzae]GMG34592.1 unnamed protein product [Aspergillus oryzae]GMG40772.1 unnamed protein product [Aspergillus oryzae var. brunneus]
MNLATMRSSGLSLLVGALLASASPLKTSRYACQTALSCPEGTILVSKTDPSAHFTSVQDAILSLPNDNTTQTILILPGTYKEQVNVTRSGPVTLLGQTDDPNNATKNKVTLTWAQANHDNTGQAVDNVFSSVLTVAPTLESSYTGSGTTGYPVPEDTPFGNIDFRAYNIDFTNTWRDYSDGPAHAISFNFVYGFGTAWIQSSEILLRNCGGGITAWKGTNTTFTNNYGVYIVDSTVKAANASIAPEIRGKCALGRPWNSQHRSIFARTSEDASIIPAGYIDWIVDGEGRLNKDTVMAEYKASGPGFNATGREDGNVTIVMDDKEYARYSSPARVFQYPDGRFGNIGWIDLSVDKN